VLFDIKVCYYLGVLSKLIVCERVLFVLMR
jgi:hypothetical protein